MEASHPDAEPARVSALDDALDPARAEVALGDDPRAAGLVEISQIWSDTLLSVRHFARQGDPVTVSDHPPRRRAVLSAVVILLWVVGAAALGVRHLTLSPAPELSAEDEALIAAWTAEREASARESVSDRQEAGEDTDRADGPHADPLADRVDAFRAVEQARLDAARRAMERGQSERRLLQAPPFALYAQADWEAFVRDELLPAVREPVLEDTWRHVLSAMPAPPSAPEDPRVARIAEDMPPGPRILLERGPDAEPWMVIHGLDPDHVTVARGDERREIAPRDPVWLAPVAPDHLAARVALSRAVGEVLFRDALARRSMRGLCSATDTLLALPSDGPRHALHARAAACALDRGEPELAAAALTLADGPLDLTRDPEAKTVLLRARARHARVRLDAAIADGHSEARRQARAETRDALHGLRAHVLTDLRDPSDLKAVARELARVHEDEVHHAQEDLAASAGLLGLLILLLLPVALVLDERRSRRAGGDFTAPGVVLPSEPYPLVTREQGAPTVHVPEGVPAWLLDADDTRRPVTGDVSLGDGARLVAEMGDTTFVVRAVRTPRGVPGDGTSIDWGYAGVLAALLMISAAFTVVLSTADSAPTLTVEPPDSSVAVFKLNQPDPPTPAVAKPKPTPDAGEGARAPGPEGQVGRERAQLRKARGSRRAVSKEQRDKEIAQKSNLFLALDRLSDDGIFGHDGLDDRVATATGGLDGRLIADQRGWGGALRGDGDGGGCMREDCGPEHLRGLGVDGVGDDRRGDGKRPGELGKRTTGSPTSGMRDPIVLGSIDKSVVARIVATHLPRIRACYERELQKQPSLAGKLTVKFVIAKDGSVATASSRSDTLGSPPVAECVHSRFRQMRFPKPRGGGIVTVSYPLVFDAR